MNDKKKTYSKQIIEIADILFSNTDIKIAGIVRDFAQKCGKSPKTVERWVKKAKEYNKNRLEKQEKIKDEVLSEETKKALKNGILSRMEALEILSKIAKGEARRINDEIYVPSDSERTRAVQQLAAMEGWEATKKISIIDGLVGIDTGMDE